MTQEALEYELAQAQMERREKNTDWLSASRRLCLQDKKLYYRRR